MNVAVTAEDEAFLLELLNSTPIVDGTARDELDPPAIGRAWLRAHGHRGSAAELATVRAARASLQAVVRGERRPRLLGRLLDGVCYRPAGTDDGVRWRLDAPEGHAPAAQAVLAWDALLRTRPGRLRPCANPDCALFLIDHSKPNRARWCSMAACGNRMKARRHYERTRAGQPG